MFIVSVTIVHMIIDHMIIVHMIIDHMIHCTQDHCSRMIIVHVIICLQSDEYLDVQLERDRSDVRMEVEERRGTAAQPLTDVLGVG